MHLVAWRKFVFSWSCCPSVLKESASLQWMSLSYTKYYMEEEEWYKQTVIDKVSGEGEMSCLQGKGIFLMTLLIYNVMFRLRIFFFLIF